MKYFKSKYLIKFMKGFDSDSYDLNNFTGDYEEITKREFDEEKRICLHKVMDQLERGYYLIQQYECLEYDSYLECFETVDMFYKIVKFVKKL